MASVTIVLQLIAIALLLALAGQMIADALVEMAQL